MNTKYNFPQLINPITKEEFIRDYFEKKPLIIKRENRDYFNDLFTLTAADAIIHQSDLKLTMSHAGKRILPEEYVNSWNSDRVAMQTGVNQLKLFERFQQDKATMIIHNAASHNIALHDLVESMEDEFNCNSGVNLFITPSNAQCFQVHYDEHDLFIIQISGSKHWKIFESAVYLPFEPQNKKAVDFSGLALLHDIYLEAGDLLYLPRGYVHEVNTTNELSCHITLGILNTTWIKRFADYVTQLASEDATFRKSYLREGDREQVISQLKQKLHDKLSEEDIQLFFEKQLAGKKVSVPIPSLVTISMQKDELQSTY